MLSLKVIKENIELMDKYHQVEVLRILKEDKSVVLNENSNGIFVNLTDLNPTTAQKLENYISYVNKQQSQLNSIEFQKEKLENTYFKDNKEIGNIKVSNGTCV